MSRYFLVVAVCACGLIASGFAQEQVKPVAKEAPIVPLNTLQIQPLGKILADVKATAAAFGGEQVAKQLDEALAEKLGDKGFTGLDLTRPVVGYQILKDDVQDPAGVLLIPVTSETEFLEFLERIDVENEAVENDAGLYELTPPDGIELGENSLFLRVKDGIAYISINAEATTLAIDKLPAAATLFIPNETSWLTARTYLSRTPKDILDKMLKANEEVGEQFDQLPLPPEVKDQLNAILKVSQKYTALQYEQGEVTTTRLNLDPRTLTLTMDYVLEPKAGTDMAQGIAARKPSTNQYAGLLTPDTAIGFATKLPLFLPEMREGAEGLIQFAEDKLLEEAPEEFQPTLKEVFATLARTMKRGDFDIASALTGPNADGQFTLTLGIALDDARPLEKEFRKLHADADENVKKIVKLDAAKVGDTVIHKALVGAFLPPELQNIVGDEATVALAFSPKGLLVTVSRESVESAKKLLAATSNAAPTDVLDLKLNAKRMNSLGEVSGDGLMQTVFPANSADELKPLATISVAGGESLTARFEMNLRVLSKIAQEK